MKPDHVSGAKEPASGPTPADPAVIRLVAAQRVHGMYPRNNPNVRVAMGKLRESLAVFPPGEGLQLEVDREQLKFADQVVLPQQGDVRDFANRLYLAHIAGIGIDPEASEDELLLLFDILRLKDDERAALGPLEEALPARGAQHVFLREAGKVKIVETEAADPDAWDITSLAELEGLEKKIFGALGRTGFREVLRSVASGQNLRASRLVAMLERPAEFAQYMIEIATKLKPHDKVDLNSQISFLEALLAKMAPVIDKTADHDQIRLYLKLDEVTASLATGLHKGMFAFTDPPFVRVGEVAALFPEVVRDLDIAETLSSPRAPSAGTAPVLMGSLRRIAGGDRELAAFLNQWILPPPPLDTAALASYRAATLPAGSPDAPPLPLPPDFLLPASTGPSATAFEALAQAAAAANGTLDSIETLLDLITAERDLDRYKALIATLTDRFAQALEAHNVLSAATALGALHAERMLKEGSPELAPVLRGAIGRCGEADVMRAFTATLSSMPATSEGIRQSAELVQSLGQNAIVSLIDILAVEGTQSTRRKLLDVLVHAGREHLSLIASYGTHPQWFVVRNVVWILGRLGPDAVPAIQKVAQHREPRVRREAVRSCAQIATPEAVRIVLGYVQDRDESVIREAVTKLATLKVGAGASAINALVQSPRFPELEGDTMTSVARALAVLGNSDSAALLEQWAQAKVAKGWLRAPEIRQQLQASAAGLRTRLAAGAKDGTA